jgi:hypothetical protein
VVLSAPAASAAPTSRTSPVTRATEVLCPPLTYLRFNGVQEEEVAGVKLLVVNVKAQIVGT